MPPRRTNRREPVTIFTASRTCSEGLECRRSPRQPFLKLALAFCICFGLALIANTQTAGDGSWFWYATLLRNGTRLYSDLKLPLQPLFPLETKWLQSTFGEGWLVSKIPAVLHLLALALGIYFLAARSGWTDGQKAAILCGSFFIGIRFVAYRFDDYHVITHACFLVSAVLLLAIIGTPTAGRRFALSAALGAVAGIAFVTRLNDGAALFAYSAAAILITVRPPTLRLLAVYAACFALTAFLVLGATGDTLGAWASASILHAGGIKGGNAQFLSDPVQVIVTAWSFLLQSNGGARIGEVLALALAWAFLIAPALGKGDPLPSRAKNLALGTLVVTGAIALLRPLLQETQPDESLLTLGVFAIYLGALYVVVKLALHVLKPGLAKWRPEEFLLSMPFAMIVSDSFSSGGSFHGLYTPIGALIAITPAVFAASFRGRPRSTCVGFVALLTLLAVWFRYNDPFSWINYRVPPLFERREVIEHPAYGPMVIDERLLRFNTQICALVNNGDPQPQLLSMPLPYENYYCAVPPWHSFVQTWYDTTPRAVVDDLSRQLSSGPPKWVLYQRQLGALASHEIVYNGGRPLPHRALDAFIMQRIADAQWKIVFREIDGDSDWLLLRTREDTSREPSVPISLLQAHGLGDWQIEGEIPRWSERSGVYTVAASNATASQSILYRTLSFGRDGPISITVWIEAEHLNSRGAFGYTADLVDEGNNVVVGSLGYDDRDSGLRRHVFTANVVATHAYQLSLRYQSATGTVSFSKLAIRAEATAASGGSGNGVFNGGGQVASSLAGWPYPAGDSHPPSDATVGGGFADVHE